MMMIWQDAGKKTRNIYIERKKIQSSQLKINTGLERKRKCDENLARCWENNKKLPKKYSPPPISHANH